MQGCSRGSGILWDLKHLAEKGCDIPSAQTSPQTGKPLGEAGWGAEQEGLRGKAVSPLCTDHSPELFAELQLLVPMTLFHRMKGQAVSGRKPQEGSLCSELPHFCTEAFLSQQDTSLPSPPSTPLPDTLRSPPPPNCPSQTVL